MDWENKFKSILRETEVNLSRVKDKFNTRGGQPWQRGRYPTNMKKASSMLDLPVASAPLYNGDHVAFTNSLRVPAERPLTDVSYRPDKAIDYGTGASSDWQMIPTTHSLQEKLEEQNRALDQLRGLVHRLETDRSNYMEQIRDLRNEILQLSNKSSERRTDPQMERRMEQVKRELLSEIQMLQSQLQFSSAKGSGSHFTESQLLSLNRDVLEIKHAYRDELETLRRDVEVLRSRVAKIELEFTNSIASQRELERKQYRMDRALHSVPVSSSKLPVTSVMSSVISPSRELEKMQIQELRSQLSALQGKLDILETVESSTITPRKHTPVSNGFTSRTKTKANGFPMTLDDLNLSDDDDTDSDFTEFKAEISETRKKSVDLDTVNTDDLDLDDLNLSDDEELSEPLDSEDL